MQVKPQQLALSLAPNSLSTFDEFVVGDNDALVSLLRHQAQTCHEPLIYLWGERSCGRKHLLQATCQSADQQGWRCLYLPLVEHIDASPDILQGLDNVDLLCIADIDVLQGRDAWQQSFFHLFNRLRDQGSSLIVSGLQAANQLPISLPDLRSRLTWGVSFHVQSLNDEQKVQLLQQLALQRGMKLADEICHYILTRAPRDVASLFTIIDHLDKASLEAQRRLTIPFVKVTLNW